MDFRDPDFIRLDEFLCYYTTKGSNESFFQPVLSRNHAFAALAILNVYAMSTRTFDDRIVVPFSFEGREAKSLHQLLQRKYQPRASSP